MPYIQESHKPMFELAKVCVPSFAYQLELVPILLDDPIFHLVVPRRAGIGDEILGNDTLKGVWIQKVGDADRVSQDGLPELDGKG